MAVPVATRKAAAVTTRAAANPAPRARQVFAENVAPATANAEQATQDDDVVATKDVAAAVKVVESAECDTHKRQKTEEAAALARLEQPLWEDLDADDAMDPVMVSEYVVEIFEYLRELEVN